MSKDAVSLERHEFDVSLVLNAEYASYVDGLRANTNRKSGYSDTAARMQEDCRVSWVCKGLTNIDDLNAGRRRLRPPLCQARKTLWCRSAS